MATYSSKDLEDFELLATNYISNVETFKQSFYTASPDRSLLRKKPYKDYVTRWKKTETFYQIYMKVNTYPKWHWAIRLWHWLLNDDTYKKYHWIVYQRCKKELQYEQYSLQRSALNDQPEPLQSRLSLEHINYLPLECRKLLQQFKTAFNQISTLWNTIIHGCFREEVKPLASDLHDNYLGLMPLTTDQGRDTNNSEHLKVQNQESKQTKELTSENLVSPEIKRHDMKTRKLYAEICGFLNHPQGTSLETLKQTFHQLNPYDGGSRQADLSEEMKILRRKMRQSFDGYAQHFGRLTLLFKSENITPSDYKTESSNTDLQKAYHLGLNAAKDSWIPFTQANDACFILYIQLCATLFGPKVSMMEDKENTTESKESFSLNLERLPSFEKLYATYSQLSNDFQSSPQILPGSMGDEKEAEHFIHTQAAFTELMESMKILSGQMRKSAILSKRSFQLKDSDITTSFERGLKRHATITSWLKSHPPHSGTEKKTELPDTVKAKLQLSTVLRTFGSTNNKVDIFLFGCGMLGLSPEKVTPSQVWSELRKRYLKPAHPDSIPKTYIDEQGVQQRIPPELIQETIEEFYRPLFQDLSEDLGCLSTMKKEEVTPNYFPARKQSIIKEGKSYGNTIDNHLKSIVQYPIAKMQKDIEIKRVKQLDEELQKAELKLKQLEAAAESKKQAASQSLPLSSEPLAETKATASATYRKKTPDALPRTIQKQHSSTSDLKISSAPPIPSAQSIPRRKSWPLIHSVVFKAPEIKPVIHTSAHLKQKNLMSGS